MEKIHLGQVFKLNGVPVHTFVEPQEFSRLLVCLRTPGRGLVVEGPSGIGKTTAVLTALKTLCLDSCVTMLSARRRDDLQYIRAIESLGDAGTVIIDDFHKLAPVDKAAVADYMKTLADAKATTTRLVLVGINKAGEQLIKFATDLNNRIEVISFGTNTEAKVDELLSKGEDALNINLNVRNEITSEARGSFYLAQLLAHEVCLRSQITESCVQKTTTQVSFEAIKADVIERLARTFSERCKRFCRGPRFQAAGRAPYLHILHWLAESNQWTLSIRNALRAHPGLKNSVGQVLDKGFLQNFISKDPEIESAIHFEPESDMLTVEDPQFVFYVRNIPWKTFASELGFVSVEFKNRYDFALSFAGSDRELAEFIFIELQDRQLEVFYDKNETHRILAADVEEYLKPIYQSESRFVVALFGREYPQRVWAKIESDAFRERMKADAIVPIAFSDSPLSALDPARSKGFYEVDRSRNLREQAASIAELLSRKISDA